MRPASRALEIFLCGNDFLAFFDKTFHAFAFLAFHGFAERFKNLVEARNMIFGFLKVLLETFTELIIFLRPLPILEEPWSLLFGVVDVGQFIEK